MAKFFILDPSLRSTGEHHFDFATCLAEAGRELGFEPIIGAHRSFKPPASLSQLAEIRPHFQGTTYDGPSYLAGMERMQRRPSPWLSARSPSRWLSALTHSWQQTGLMRRRQAFQAVFLRDCEHFFAHQTFQADDHVLFAAVTELEVMAAAQFLARTPGTLAAHWHWLFHFPVFESPHENLSVSSTRERELRACLQLACQQMAAHRISFFATTDGLVDQYRQLAFAPVWPLAYPISRRFAPEPLPADESENELVPRPMRIVCPGAIRREKGQKSYLPELAEQMADQGLKDGRLQLVLQVPRSRTPRWPRWSDSLGGSQIRTASPELFDNQPICLLEHPLPEAHYAQLLSGTDCGLLMYDSSDYFVRRAGILGELLSLGRPVIVSAANWLADQLKAAHFQYAARWTQAAPSGRILGLSDCRWSSNNVPMPGGLVSFDEGRHPFDLTADREADESGCVLQFRWFSPQRSGQYCRIELLDGSGNVQHVQVVGQPENGNLASVFWRFDFDHQEFRLKFTNQVGQAMVGLKDLTLTYLDASVRAAPLAVVGLVAADPTWLPKLILEMREHYRHYRQTARRFAPRWSAAHRPTATLGRLLAAAESVRRAA